MASDRREASVLRAARRFGATSVFFASTKGGASRAVARDLASETPLDEHLLFELASVTKPFVGLLLARLAEDSVVALDDPAARFLPHGVVPEASGGITLRQLATHTSGLANEASAAGGREGDDGRYVRTTEELYDVLAPHAGFEPAMATALEPHHRHGRRRSPKSTGLAWSIDGASRVTHSGATSGFTLLCGFDRAVGSAVVLALDAGVSAVPMRPRAVPILVHLLRLRRAAMAALA